MIDRGKHNILGIPIAAVDYQAAAQRVIEAAKHKQGLAVSALAVHGLMTGVLDPRTRYHINRLDLAVPDGQPVRWALNWLHRTGLAERVYGPELMLRICRLAAEESLPIYLYGGRPVAIEPLSKALPERFPGLTIAGARPGLYRTITAEERDRLVGEIRGSGAALVFVGLGCPIQEIWISEYRDLLDMPLIAVGAAFDFHAGLRPQAPKFLQDRGLEWMFRLMTEPARLWKRYLTLNPMYLLLLALQASGLAEFDPDRVIPPDRESLFG